MPRRSPEPLVRRPGRRGREYYCSIFPDSRIVNVTHYAEAAPDKAGQVLTVDFELQGQRFTALNGGPEFSFNEAVSLMVECADQEELDRYWERCHRRRRGGPVRLVQGPLRALVAGRARPAWTSCSATTTPSARGAHGGDVRHAQARHRRAARRGRGRGGLSEPHRSSSRPASRAAVSAASSWRSTIASPRSQKPGSARSTPTILPELLGRARAAGRQQLEVGGHERLALLLVAAVDREREQLPVGVRVDVARRADEVRDVGPPGARSRRSGRPRRRAARPGTRPTARRSARRPARPARGAPCARGARSGSSRPGGTRWRPRRRRSRSAATGASRASRPARAAGRRRSARRTRSRSRRASAACPCGRRPGAPPSAACTPWPSSCASVSTSRRL